MWAEERHLENKIKSCQPRIKTLEMERTFQESAWKLYRNRGWTRQKYYKLPTRLQTRKVYVERT